MRILVFCFFTVLTTIKTQAQTTIEKPDGVTVTTYPDGVTVTKYPNGVTKTSSGSCDMWIIDWKEDGLLRDKVMNEKEQSIFDDLVGKLPEGHRVEISMVYYSKIKEEMWVLYELTLNDGTVHRSFKDLDNFTSWVFQTNQ
ncbi:MAG: T-complex 10 C-terminal domain-containing protein [Bacteroidia bacterium]